LKYDLNRGSHSLYYHLIFVVKYRKKEGHYLTQTISYREVVLGQVFLMKKEAPCQRKGWFTNLYNKISLLKEKGEVSQQPYILYYRVASEHIESGAGTP